MRVVRKSSLVVLLLAVCVLIGWSVTVSAQRIGTPPLRRPPILRLTMKRLSLKNVDDAAGRWQFAGGQVLIGAKQVANYASTKRVVWKGTDAQNTAMLTVTIFFLGKKPPENITLQGSHDFTSGGQAGSVSAASPAYALWIGKKFTRVGDVITIR